MNNTQKIYSTLFKYGYHDTRINKIEVSDDKLVFFFEEGLYTLDEDGKEQTLTGPIALEVSMDTENAFDSISVTELKGHRVKYSWKYDNEKILKELPLEVSNLYFSQFDNEILLTVGNHKKSFYIVISNCKDVVVK